MSLDSLLVLNGTLGSELSHSIAHILTTLVISKRLELLLTPVLCKLLVLVISRSSYDFILYYHGLPYLLPTCYSFRAPL